MLFCALDQDRIDYPEYNYGDGYIVRTMWAFRWFYDKASIPNMDDTAAYPKAQVLLYHVLPNR